MKKILIGILALFTFTACSDEYYDSLNVDPMHPSDVPAGFLVTSALNSYFQNMLNTNVNTNVFRLYAQQWTETQYTQEANYILDERNINGNLVNRLIHVIKDLEDARGMVVNDVSASPAEKANQNAVIDLVQIQAWQVLVDTFGDIPYTEALDGVTYPTPAYDDAATIYHDLIQRAQDATAAIDASAGGFGANDIVYLGDMNKWKTLGYTIQLKLGITFAYVNPSVAQAVINDQLAAKVMQSSADNFTLVYPGAEPYVNPLWVDLVKSGRKDFVGANTLVDFMNGKDDPRRAKYFEGNITDDDGNVIYVGGIYGEAQQFYDDHTHVSQTLHDINYPGTLLDYSETLFLLAEAAGNGFISGTAGDYYAPAIQASMDFWEVSADDAAEYLDRADVDWGSAPGSWQEKLAMQYYLGMYNKGFDAWTVYRRLGGPELNLAALSNLPVPRRFTYPVAERNLNATNYAAAAAAMGGDELTTRIFWDTH